MSFWSTVTVFQGEKVTKTQEKKKRKKCQLKVYQAFLDCFQVFPQFHILATKPNKAFLNKVICFPKYLIVLSTGKTTWSVGHSLKPRVLSFALPNTWFELVRTFHLTSPSHSCSYLLYFGCGFSEQQFEFVQHQPQQELDAGWDSVVDVLLVTFWGHWEGSSSSRAPLGCARCCGSWLAHSLALLLLSRCHVRSVR